MSHYNGCGCDEGCNSCTSHNEIQQAVNDALALEKENLEQYESNAAQSATDAAKEAAKAAKSASAAAQSQTNAETAAGTATQAASSVTNTAVVLEETAERIEQAQDLLEEQISALQTKPVYFEVSSPASSLVLPETETVFNVRSIYVASARQDVGYGFTFDKATRTITLADGITADDIAETEEGFILITAICDVYSSDDPTSFPIILASTAGASNIGTSAGITVEGALTNNHTNDREQWRRSLAEAGLTLVDGSFEEGATANSATDAIWHIAGGQCYVWSGGSSTLPKVVPAGSTPETAGGIGLGAWVSVGDASLRSDLSSSTGSSLIKHGESTVDEVLYSILSVADISNMAFTDKTTYSLRGWNPSTAVENQTVGGGRFIYMASLPRVNHDGGVVIDVSVPYTNTAAYLAGTGSAGGSGCLVRIDVKEEYQTSWFGALPSTTGVDAYASVQKCMDSANAKGMQVLVTDTVLISKPLILKSQSIFRGCGRYKTFILKINNSTSGLPPVAKPSDAPGPVDDVTMDVDAVVIIAPYNSGEYATFIHIADISFENNANPANGVQPEGSFGIYAPFINLSSIERCQVYKVDVAIYSKTMWMTRLSQWRAFTVNHNVWVDQGGTSLSFENVWVQGCSYGAYYFKGVGYSNFIQMSADGLGNQTEFGGFAYRFLNCENCKALLSVEDSDNIGVISVESSVMDIQIQAKHGVRGGASNESLIAVIGSRVTFSESDVDLTSLGSMTPKFYGTSFITTNNSDFFNDATAYTDDTTRIVNISDSLSISGRIRGFPFKTTVGADAEMRGVWDSSGRLVFKSPDGSLTYGVLFANSANNLLWKQGGYPQSNIDGVKLN